MFIVHFMTDQHVADLARLFKTHKVLWPAVGDTHIKESIPQPLWVAVAAGNVREEGDKCKRISESEVG